LADGWPCIGIARLLCDALLLGYTAEVLHLARALHEADHLVSIFVLDEGAGLLRKWLADEGDEWVQPGEVRAAEEKFEERLMGRCGVTARLRSAERVSSLVAFMGTNHKPPITGGSGLKTPWH
jgi:hypothetical protein